MKVLLTIAALTLGSMFVGNTAQAANYHSAKSQGNHGQKTVIVVPAQGHRPDRQCSRHDGRRFHGRRDRNRHGSIYVRPGGITIEIQIGF